MLISLTYMEMSEENIRAVHVAGGLSPDHIISPSCSSVQDFFFNKWWQLKHRKIKTKPKEFQNSTSKNFSFYIAW